MCNLCCPHCSPCCYSVWLPRNNLHNCCSCCSLRVGVALFAFLLIVIDVLLLAGAIRIALVVPRNRLAEPHDPGRKPLYYGLVKPLEDSAWVFYLILAFIYFLWLILDIALLGAALALNSVLLSAWIILSLERYIHLIIDTIFIILIASFSLLMHNMESKIDYRTTLLLVVFHVASLLVLLLLIYVRWVVNSLAFHVSECGAGDRWLHKALAHTCGKAAGCGSRASVACLAKGDCCEGVSPRQSALCRPPKEAVEERCAEPVAAPLLCSRETHTAQNQTEGTCSVSRATQCSYTERSTSPAEPCAPKPAPPEELVQACTHQIPIYTCPYSSRTSESIVSVEPIRHRVKFVPESVQPTVYGRRVVLCPYTAGTRRVRRPIYREARYVCSAPDDASYSGYSRRQAYAPPPDAPYPDLEESVCLCEPPPPPPCACAPPSPPPPPCAPRTAWIRACPCQSESDERVGRSPSQCPFASGRVVIDRMYL